MSCANVWYKESGNARRRDLQVPGDVPRLFLFKGVVMSELGIFVDESGDGSTSRYDLLTLVFHD